MNTLTKWNPFRKSNELEEWGSITRWNPIREMERMQSRMNQIFGSWPELKEPMTVTEWSPLVDIVEEEREYLLKAEVPEVKKEDLKVKVEDGVLSIIGERKAEKEEKGKKYHRIERCYGSFERSFTLPDDADGTKVTSEFKDGVLKIHLPKNPNAKSKAIDVKIQ
ncbi:MAG: Hsp20/alpha crystallin family protein [Verrucomicrobia bacterium]|nr:Hsp20/alpha crystallin family protein [Verrucomicrobiota bacterium]